MLILGLGIFVIAFATLFVVYSGQSSGQEELEGSLAAAQARLPKLISEREDLESQLTQWEGELAEATSLLSKIEARFPKSAESIEYDEALFEIAEDCNLEVIGLAASEPRDKKVEDITYTISSFEVKVRGEVDDMLDMVSAIATSEYFTTATVELVNIEIPEPEEEETEMPEATIELVGYSYQGE